MTLSRKQFSQPIFHRTHMREEEFLRSPMLHVGTEMAAAQMFGTTHRFKWSPYVEFHDELLSDRDVNAIHSEHLYRNGLPTPTSVVETRNPNRHSSSITRGLKALSENKVIPYLNAFEDRGSTSFLVPSPWLNLRKPRTKGSMSQHVLPIDYSMVNKSGFTEDQLLVQKENPEFFGNDPISRVSQFDPLNDVSEVREAAANLRKRAEKY